MTQYYTIRFVIYTIPTGSLICRRGFPMHISMRLVRAVAATLVLSLAACSGGGEAAIPPRPVLVAHPGADAAGTTLAYPREVRAREEAAQSLRVRGRRVRYLIELVQQVHDGQTQAE